MTTLPLKLVAASDPSLDCIVCRRLGVDRLIVYGIAGGQAAQGIHARCVGRALAIRSNRSMRRRARGVEA